MRSRRLREASSREISFSLVRSPLRFLLNCSLFAAGGKPLAASLRTDDAAVASSAEDGALSGVAKFVDPGAATIFSAHGWNQPKGRS